METNTPTEIDQPVLADNLQVLENPDNIESADSVATLKTDERDFIRNSVTETLFNEISFLGTISSEHHFNNVDLTANFIVADYEVFKISFSKYAKEPKYRNVITAAIDGKWQDFYQFAGEFCVEFDSQDAATYYYKKSCYFGGRKARWSYHCLSMCFLWKANISHALICSFLSVCTDRNNKHFANQFNKVLSCLAGSLSEAFSEELRALVNFVDGSDLDIKGPTAKLADTEVENCKAVVSVIYRLINNGQIEDITDKIIKENGLDLHLQDDFSLTAFLQLSEVWSSQTDDLQLVVNHDLGLLETEFNLDDWDSSNNLLCDRISTKQSILDIDFVHEAIPEIATGSVDYLPVFLVVLSRLNPKFNPNSLFLFGDQQSNYKIGHATGNRYLSFLEVASLDYDASPTNWFDPAYFARSCKLSGAALNKRNNKFIQYLTNQELFDCDPSPIFDSGFVCRQLRYADRNPLIAFLSQSKGEHVSPHPVFDIEYLSGIEGFQGLPPAGIVKKYIDTPKDARPPISRVFDPGYYITNNPDIGESCPNIHFLRYGNKENRLPNRFFSNRYVSEQTRHIDTTSYTAVNWYLEKESSKSTTVVCLPDVNDTFAYNKLLRTLKEENRERDTSVYLICLEQGQLPKELKKQCHSMILGQLKKNNEGKVDKSQYIDQLFAFFSRNGADRFISIDAAPVRLFSRYLGSFRDVTTVLATNPANSSEDELDAVHSLSTEVVYENNSDFDYCKKWRSQGTEYSIKAARSSLPPYSRWKSAQRHLLPAETTIGKFAFFCANLDEVSLQIFRRILPLLSEIEGFAINIYVDRTADRSEFNQFSNFFKHCNILNVENAFEENSQYKIVNSDFVFVLSDLRKYKHKIMDVVASGVVPIINKDSLLYADFVESNKCIAIDIFALESSINTIKQICKDKDIYALLKAKASNMACETGDSNGSFNNSSLIKLPQVFRKNLHSQKTILFLSSDWSVSGVNTFTHHLVKNLVMQGYDAKILFTRGKDTDYPTSEYMPSVPFEFLNPDVSGVWYTNVWESLRQYTEQYKNCIIVPNYDFVASSVSPILPSNVGVVGIAHSDDAEHYEQCYRLGLWWNEIVTVSDTIKDRLMDLNSSFNDKTNVIYYGIPEAGRLAREQVEKKHHEIAGPIKLVYTGRLVSEQKRVEKFAQLTAELDKLGIDYIFNIVGEGPMGDFLKEKFSKNDRVVMHGRLSQDRLSEILQESHIFLLLSDYEGLPLSLLEALREGCVPVLNKIESGVSEIITSNENGVLIENSDLSAMAHEIRKLKESHEIRRKMALAAYDSFADFGLNLESMCTKYIEVFDRVFQSIGEGDYTRKESLNSRASNFGIIKPSWLN